MPYAAITGWGYAVPDRVLTSQELETRLQLPEGWIVSRTGIEERRIAGPEDTSTSLGAAAGQRALDRAGMAAAQLDLIVVATATPIPPLVPQASLIQSELGGSAGTFDTGAASAGFVTALGVASQYITAGVFDRVLVIGVDTLTRYVDYTDRSTSILFGDGAGAVVLEATPEPRGMISTVLGADGRGRSSLYIPGLGRSTSPRAGTAPAPRPYLLMNGSEVFRFAVRTMDAATREAVRLAGLTFEEIAMLVPHQANRRIIDAASRSLGISRDKVWVNIDRFGNTTSASVVIALAEAADSGTLGEGDHVALVGFGAGLAWAAGVVRWGIAGVPRRARRP